MIFPFFPSPCLTSNPHAVIFAAGRNSQDSAKASPLWDAWNFCDHNSNMYVGNRR